MWGGESDEEWRVGEAKRREWGMKEARRRWEVKEIRSGVGEMCWVEPIEVRWGMKEDRMEWNGVL